MDTRNMWKKLKKVVVFFIDLSSIGYCLNHLKQNKTKQNNK